MDLGQKFLMVFLPGREFCGLHLVFHIFHTASLDVYKRQEERSGAGVVAEVDGKSVAAGNDKLMNQLGVAFQESDEPGTVVHLSLIHI